MTDDHDVLADEFTRYRRVARATFRTPPAAGVFATARRRTVRRSVAAGIALVAAVFLALTGAVVLRPFAASPPPPGNPSPPPPTASPPPPSPGLEADVEVGNRVRFLDDSVLRTLRSMTITLPAWPGGTAGTCESGRHTFSDGAAATGDGWSYRILNGGLRGIFANLDCEPGDEILTPLGCSPEAAGELSFELLAISVGPGGPARSRVRHRPGCRRLRPVLPRRR